MPDFDMLDTAFVPSWMCSQQSYCQIWSILKSLQGMWFSRAPPVGTQRICETWLWHGEGKTCNVKFALTSPQREPRSHFGHSRQHAPWLSTSSSPFWHDQRTTSKSRSVDSDSSPAAPRRRPELCEQCWRYQKETIAMASNLNAERCQVLDNHPEPPTLEMQRSHLFGKGYRAGRWGYTMPSTHVAVFHAAASFGVQKQKPSACSRGWAPMYTALTFCKQGWIDWGLSFAYKPTWCFFPFPVQSQGPSSVSTWPRKCF